MATKQRAYDGPYNATAAQTVAAWRRVCAQRTPTGEDLEQAMNCLAAGIKAQPVLDAMAKAEREVRGG